MLIDIHTAFAIFFFVIAFISEILGAIAGFGSSTVFLPLALFFVDFKTALVLVSISHLFGNLGRVKFFSQGLDKNIIIRFGIPSVLFALVGASIVNFIPQNILKVLLGLFLIVISISFLIKPGLKFPSNTRTIITGGCISGFITGLVGTGGALRATFLTGSNLEKIKYIATAAVIALSTDIIRIPSYISQGFLIEQYIYYIPILFVTALSGSFIGRQITKKINQNIFRKIVLVAIIFVSTSFVIGGVVSR
jgi:uncharacterized protein